MGSGGSARAQTRAGWGNLVLRETDLGNVSTWCSLVESRHHRKLNVAASRLLRAVRERDQPDDALVDAVISLEALFGVGEVSETTFRVSAACARLLEADLAKRQEVRKRIADAYGARSRLVHGAQLEAQDIERPPRCCPELRNRSLPCPVEPETRPHRLRESRIGHSVGVILGVGRLAAPGVPQVTSPFHESDLHSVVQVSCGLPKMLLYPRRLAAQRADDGRPGEFDGLLTDFSWIRVGGRVVEFPQGRGPSQRRRTGAHRVLGGPRDAGRSIGIAGTSPTDVAIPTQTTD